MKKFLLSLLLAVAVSGCATDGNSPSGTRPETVEMLVRQGGDALFLGRAHGMDGWLVKLGDNVRAMYVAPDGKGVVVGLMHDENGDNLTVRQIEALQPSGDAEPVAAQEEAAAQEPGNEDAVAASPASAEAEQDPAKAAWEAAGTLAYVPIGNADAPVIYVMFDPRCSYCALYLSDLLEGPISARKLNVRMVPVSVLGDASVRLAASLLGAPVPAEAILRHAIGRSMELPEPTEENMAVVRHNSEVLSGLGLRSTPRTIYRTPAGEYGVITGAPQNLAAFITLVTAP